MGEIDLNEIEQYGVGRKVWLRTGSVAGSCGHGNEPSGFIYLIYSWFIWWRFRYSGNLWSDDSDNEFGKKLKDAVVS
jgi:hypothetical protein